MSSTISTDGLRIKSLQQKNGQTYPFGADGIYIDMLSGLDLQEQLILNNNLHSLSSTINYNYASEEQIATQIIEIFSDTNSNNIYKKQTIIYPSKQNESDFVTDISPASSFFVVSDSEILDDNAPHLGIKFTAKLDLGDIVTKLYRQENSAWSDEPIHTKRTSFNVDLQDNILGVNESFE